MDGSRDPLSDRRVPVDASYIDERAAGRNVTQNVKLKIKTERWTE